MANDRHRFHRLGGTRQLPRDCCCCCCCCCCCYTANVKLILLLKRARTRACACPHEGGHADVHVRVCVRGWDSKNSPEGTPNPRRDSARTGLYHVYELLSSLMCMIALFARSLFLGLKSLLGNLGILRSARRLSPHPGSLGRRLCENPVRPDPV